MSWFNVKADSAKFLVEFVRKPTVTGAIAPSSRQLAERVVDWIDWSQTSSIIEWGPGTGAFTEVILERKPEDCRYLAMELSPEMCATLRRRFPGIELCQESVSEVVEVCQKECIEEVDCVVSGLPWAAFSEKMQKEFMDALTCVLRPGGQFTTFAYLHGMTVPAGQRFRKTLHKYFSEVSQSPTVWRNLPPAFVYRCRR